MFWQVVTEDSLEEILRLFQGGSPLALVRFGSFAVVQRPVRAVAVSVRTVPLGKKSLCVFRA